MLIFKISNFLVAPLNSLISTAAVSSTSELISEITGANKSRISSSRTGKTESEISYGLGERENQFKQSSISSDEKVKVPKL